MWPVPNTPGSRSLLPDHFHLQALALAHSKEGKEGGREGGRERGEVLVINKDSSSTYTY